jgi:predicted ATPase
MLSKEIKREVFDAIISTSSFLGKYEEFDGILTFTNKIWDLRNMTSFDDRFKNAYEDIQQHIVNNDDWSIEYLYIDRLKILEGDEKFFILFIETVVNPIVRKDKNEIEKYVSTINSIIQSSGYRLILTSYFEELPVYKFKDAEKTIDLPNEIIENNIPIYLEEAKADIEYPSFRIHYNNWDDFGYVKTLELVYHHNNINEPIYIGAFKLMKRETRSTWETLHDKFVSLSDDYCSLGQDKNYYLQLKDVLGSNYYSFLLALRDTALFPKIYEQFENDEIFKTSLLRNNEVERLARTIRYIIEGISPNEYYKFNYSHKPLYSENAIHLNFDFEYNTIFEHRIYALIGKNGSGKTRILSSLAKSLSEKESKNFSPRQPVYGKVFTVSYSIFDRFEIPKSDALFNYVYCGLKRGNNEWKSEEELLEGFYKAAKLINSKNLEDEWYGILSNFIVKDFLDTVFDEKFDLFSESKYKFNESNFNEKRNALSSGQSIILFMISEILSQIRYDSLILFDEPETHLHPNGISALMNTLFNLVKRFQSFCVIATHSPIIIQEIPARNIFVIERDHSVASVRGLERESFGENLTVITQDIFGNREVPRHFISLIEQLIAGGKSYEEIISILETDGLPISTNVRLYIKALNSEN